MAEHDMQMDENDDIYEPEEYKEVPPKTDELEEGEEADEGGAMEEDEDDSDVDIITERKDGPKTALPPQPKYSEIRNIPQRLTASEDAFIKPTVTQKDDGSRPPTNAAKATAPSANHQAPQATSKLTMDINFNPIYAPAGKRITQVNIDEDLSENEKPWRKPGTDISDYFNYGFNEFTWALYAAKQESVRGEFGADAFAANSKKMMEDFNNMMIMGGMGLPGAAGGGAGVLPGMDGMPPEMQALMQQVMASGVDTSQMDPTRMNAVFAGMQNGMGGSAAQANQAQSFFGGNQGGFGFDPGMPGPGGGGRGAFGGGGGGGRGRRGRW